jgi:hypothetical protein
MQQRRPTKQEQLQQRAVEKEFQLYAKTGDPDFLKEGREMLRDKTALARQALGLGRRRGF